MLGDRPAVEQGDHAEDGDRAEILQRGRGGRESEPAMRIHYRRRRTDHGVQRHLWQEKQHEDGAEVRLAIGRSRIGGADRAEPEQPRGGHRHDRDERQHAEQRHPE